MWCRELSNGKFQYNEIYTDYATGKRKQVSVTLDKHSKQAENIAREILRKKIGVKRAPENKDIRLGELYTLYLEEQKHTVKESTFARNVYAKKALLNLIGAEKIVNKLRVGDIRHVMLASGKEPSTCNELIARLKALINWGNRNGYINNADLSANLHPFPAPSRREKVSDKYLEGEELKELIGAMRALHWRLLTTFLALSGLRVGEALALFVTDIEGDVIHVTKTANLSTGNLTTTKTESSTRDVPIQLELQEVINEIHAMREDMLADMGATSDYFFCQPNGTPLEYRSYHKYLKNVSAKALGRSVSPHVLRHTHASLLLQEGLTVDEISHRLGHNDSKITKEIYLHLTDRLKKKEAERIKAVRLIPK